MAKKSCKKGYYYCYASKKCKKIPKGWHVMPTGILMRDSEHKDENKEETNGKKKNGNGNGANGNGNGNGGSDGGSDGGGVSEAWSAKYKKSIDCDNPRGFSQRAHCRGRKVTEGKESKGDHEVSMAQTQLKKAEERIKLIRRKLGKKEKDLPAWMQAKITDMDHDTDAVAGYVDEQTITEKRDGKSAKSKGYSLRDWFKGGGWVQAGGKYDGKPCARQPGQKTKPFCRDADDRANMSKKERERRAAKKRREDSNPDRKGKAKVVTASYSNWRSDLEDLHEIPAALAIPLAGAAGYALYKGAKHLKKKADKALDNARQNATLGGSPFGAGARQRAIEDGAGVSRGTLNPNMQRLRNSYEPECDVVEGWRRGGDKLKSTDRIKMGGDGGLKSLNDIDKEIKAKQTQKNSYEPQGDLVDEGKKDACYHKVKSRYSVWPSAYASGALVKCRKVGAKNWGNKTKKEGYEFSNWRDDFQAMDVESVDIIKAEPLQPTKGIGSDMLGEAKTKQDKLKEISKQLAGASKMHAQQSKKVAQVAKGLDEAKKCWKGYKKVGTQKLFGKTYNRCEKIKKEEVELQEAIPGYDKYNAAVAAAKKLTGRERIDALKAAAALRPKTEKEVDQKIPESHELGEDWQKSNRNDGVDGMSQKSVNAYKRENPGSKLQTAVTGKNPKGKDKKRRKSFCARSKGQKDMHNIDCSKTPEKKICKARKRWRC